MRKVSIHKITNAEYNQMKIKILAGKNALSILINTGKLIQFFEDETVAQDGYIHTLDIIEQLFDKFTDEELETLDKINPKWYDNMCRLSVGYHPTSLKILKSFRGIVQSC